jgi:hypothetical protein
VAVRSIGGGNRSLWGEKPIIYAIIMYVVYMYAVDWDLELKIRYLI